MELFKIIEGKKRERIRLEFPKQVVIFLEENNEIGDFLEMDLILPDSSIVTYRVPALKIWEHDLNDLRRRNLYLFVPFKVFDFRKRIRGIESGSKLETEKKRLISGEFDKIIETIRNIAGIIKELYVSNEINTHDLEQMLLILNNITEYLYEKYSQYREKTVREEIGEMVTRIFDPVVLEKERMEGKIEGKMEGKMEGKIDDARKMLAEGMAVPLIVRITELPEEKIFELKKDLDDLKKH